MIPPSEGIPGVYVRAFLNVHGINALVPHSDLPLQLNTVPFNVTTYTIFERFAGLTKTADTNAP